MNKVDMWMWNRVLGFGLGLACAGLVMMGARAQDAEPAEAARPAAPAAAATVATPAVPPETVTPKKRVSEMVSVGGNVEVRTNMVADEVVVVRGSATVDGDVDGDVVVLLGKLKVTGNVRGNVVVVMGEADIQGRIREDATFVLSGVRFGSNAVVRGEVVVVGPEPQIDPGASLSDNPKLVSLGPWMRYVGWAQDYLFQGVFMLRPFPPSLGWVWVVAALFLGFHIVLGLVFHGALQGCMTTLREQPARSFLIGLLICILSGPVSVLLSFTVVAIPLIGLLFMALSVFGRVAVYAATGAGLGRTTGLSAFTQPIPALIVGSVVFYLCYMVPVLGILVYWVVIPWGVGAVTIRIYESLRRERRPYDTGGGRPGFGAGERMAAGGLASGQPGPATHAVVTPPMAGAESGAATPGTDTGPERPAEARSEGPTYTSPPVVPIPTLDLSAAPRVGFWPRFAATLIDILAVGFVNGMLLSTPRSFWFLLALYHFGMWLAKGTTLGGAVLGLKVIRLDGRPVDWQTSLVRVLGSVVSLLPLGLGFFWASWDEQAQSWHDRIAGTTVIKTPRRNPLV